MAENVPATVGLPAVKRLLADNLNTVRALLQGYATPERFFGGIVTAMHVNPDLQRCNPQSVLLSSLRIAQLRLSPDPSLGQAWLIPRKERAEFQLGYKGTLALLYRSPLVGTVRYGVVRKGEHFLWTDGAEWQLEHHPGPDGWPTKWDELEAAWAIIDLANGFQIPRVMYAAEIRRHQARGSGPQSPWRDDLAAMAVKTVLNDVGKRGPLDGEALLGLVQDDAGELGLGQQTADLEERLDGAEASRAAAATIVQRAKPAQPALTGEERPFITVPVHQAERVAEEASATRRTVDEVERAMAGDDAPPMAATAEQMGAPPADGKAKPWKHVLDMKLPQVGDAIAQRMVDAGLDTWERIHEAGAEELERRVRGVGKLMAQGIVLMAEKALNPEPDPPLIGEGGFIQPTAPAAPPVGNHAAQTLPDDIDDPPPEIPFPGQEAGKPAPPRALNTKPINKVEIQALLRHAVRTKRKGAPAGPEGDAAAVQRMKDWLADVFDVTLETCPSGFFRAALEWADATGFPATTPALEALRAAGHVKGSYEE
jgi:phage RecT family recombinase